MKLSTAVAQIWAFQMRPLHRIALIAIALLVASCATPKLEVSSEPGAVAIHMDGAPTGKTPMSLEPNYYGTVLLHAEQEIGEADLASQRSAFFGAKTALIDFSAPVTPWLFGIDLVGETLVRIFGSMDETVNLELPLVEPKSASALTTLIEESEASSLAR